MVRFHWKEQVVASRSRVAVAFGKVLRESRKQKGLSQEELAGACEFDRTYPSLLERGLRTPTITILLDIADALGRPASELVTATLVELSK
jgi:transcriptional regulator with XRE-family HTH domain